MRSIALVAVAVLALMAPASAVRADLVTYQRVIVGDSGNPADSATGYGSVAYEYGIGKYDVTIGQYAAFLNAVAVTDTYGLYDTAMGTDLNIAGISRSGSSGSYSYAVMNNGGSSANRPITMVNWFDAARFANWMANGQPTGAQDSTTTENGVYRLDGAVNGVAPAKNAVNPNTLFAPAYWIPTENEWYKAAYYQPVAAGGPSDGYWSYATRSDSLPGNDIGGAANQANWRDASGFSVTQSSGQSGSQYYLTDVGAFSGSASYYGTFDQTGNVYQWNDVDGSAGGRQLRGGSWYDNPESTSRLDSTYRLSYAPSDSGVGIGFRLAGPSVLTPVPEIAPAGLASVVAMLSGVLGLAERRRVRRRPARSRP